jgi:hypothetical protein
MLDDGCRYGMIDVEHSRWGDPRSGMTPWRLCSARAPHVYTFQGGQTLAGYVVRLMNGEVGRHVPFTNWPGAVSVACHWSLMIMELLSILPSAPVSASGGIAFLAMTPNFDEAGGHLQPTSIPDYKADEGAFGIIHVQTSGDIGEILRRDIEIGR